MRELKPCPFCGGTDLQIYSISGWGSDVIVCSNCLATFSQQEITSEQDLIIAWNRRVEDGRKMQQTFSDNGHSAEEKALPVRIRQRAELCGEDSVIQ